MRRRRWERTPSPVEDEEEEEREEQGSEEEEEQPRMEEQGSEKEEEHVEGEEDEDEEGVAEGEQKVWLRGLSQLPRRPIPLERRPMIRPLEPK